MKFTIGITMNHPRKKQNKPINRQEANTFNAIAHYEFALGADREVAGMKGFAAFYLRKLPKSQREMIVRYNTAKERIRLAICAQFEKDGNPDE